MTTTPRDRKGFMSRRYVAIALAIAVYIGAGAYVKKPYVAEKLGAAVRRELERRD